MNEITSTTAVAAETTGNAISTLLSSKTGRYAAVAVGIAVAGYAVYKGGKKIRAVLAARKAVKATTEAATILAEVVKAD